MKSSGILILALLFVPSAVLAETKTLTFQEGDGGAYSSTQGATVDYSGSAAGFDELLNVSMFGMDPLEFAFIRFPDIIGNNLGQIPPGSTVESATLQLTRNNSTTEPAHLRLVTSSWDESSTDGDSYPSAINYTGSIPAGDAGVYIIDVKVTVQGWVSGGGPNWGWSLYGGTITTDYYNHFYWSDDAPVLANRPLLSVTFTPVTTPVESTTWGKIKALYR